MAMTKHTFCRICEPLCPLVADLDDDGAVTRLRPDREHPVTRGFACHKGLSYLDVHLDPDRVDYPLRRTNPKSEPIGQFERVSWDEALADIGQRLREIRDRHGPDAISCYYGNPIAFDTKAFMPAIGLASKIGTRHNFGAGTQDMCNKPAALEAVFGSSQWTIPDFYNTQYLLCFGANPKVSHWTTVSTHKPMHVCQDIVARGGKVRFVNPRRIESIGDTTGELVQIKPDTDVYLMAALLHEIDRNKGFDEAAVARHGRRVAELRAFVARYPAERVASVTGIDADTIRRIAGEFIQAKSAAVYMSTGVNQGRQGTLAYWLLNMLSFVTGNLGARGGNYYAKGFAPVSATEPAQAKYFDTPLGEMRHVFFALPANLMADFIEVEPDPVRALLVLSGNPLLSVSGEDRLRQALPKLDLIVCLDLYRNATGEYADYILPATDWLEREDITHISNGVQPTPYVQYSDAVVAPRGERKGDWWIIARIERELGLPNMLDGDPPQHAVWLDGMLAASGLTVDALRVMPHQTALLPQPAREAFFDDLVAWPDKKVNCCPEIFDEALLRCETIFSELDSEDPQQLKMISLRTHYMHNSNLANMKALKTAKHGLNPLHIHPDDAARRGLAEGDNARIFNLNGSVTTNISFDDTLMPGVIALSHGYGHGAAPGVTRAHALPGVNANRLMPTGPGSYDKLSNMSHMTGIAVEVEKA
ncbi:MAG: putative formate dehydrogenase [Hydrocarboniphaga sp.]|uniref:molybdopterin-containing oxidoreductase family protein n=1 Tax=Hydrocarboniphaga sp. TaxID=2033016 RepID=UPI00261C0129|nr:molybdopterin-dependent oxidoreductase [Hydrocarboniphaga sp.]MDB5970137.1 putative formate dehydrogenase [Hydrocarboniphaga sp.]